MDQAPKPPIYNVVKDREIRDAIGTTQLKVLRRSHAEFEKLQNEIKAYQARMSKKYPNATGYSMYHALMLSTIPEPTHEDFPGKDSAEIFLAGLLEKYK